MTKSKFSVVYSLILIAFFSFIAFVIEASAVPMPGFRFVAPPPVGSDGNTPCDDPDFPCETIQTAVNESVPGDIIKVAEGQYDENVLIDTKDDIELWGGFPITGGVPDYDDADRDPVNNETTIDGDNPGGGTPALSILNSGSITVTGFIIQNGSADQDSCFGEGFIGGITAGGGVLVVNSSGVILEDDDVNTNTSSGAGAGIAICDSSEVEVRDGPFTNCVVENNIADGETVLTSLLEVLNIGGGGILIFKSDTKIIGCKIINNRGNGPVLADTLGDGGGLYILDSTFGTDFTLIDGNDANKGGGMYIKRSFADILGEEFQINETTISRNTAHLGFGLLGDEGFFEDGDGGGIACDESSIQTRRGEITDNLAMTGNGGGVWGINCQSIILYATPVTFNIADENGGGAYIDMTNLELEGDFFLSNIAQAGDGGGVYLTNDSVFEMHDIDLFPSAINDNQAGNAANEDSTGRGGGIFCENGGAMTIGNGLASAPLPPNSRMQIIGNKANGGLAPGTIGAGGGIYVGFSCTLEAVDVDILQNISVGEGGGVAFDNIPDPDDLGIGGGLLFPNPLSNGDFLRAEIDGNIAFNPGGGIFIGDAGDTLLDIPPDIIDLAGGKLTIRNTCIRGNTAECDVISDFPGCGGGIGIGKGINLSLTTDVTMENTCITQNLAFGDFLSANGGGISVVDEANVSCNHCTIVDNTATGRGGGVFVTVLSTINILNSIVYNNEAPTAFINGEEQNAGEEGEDIWCSLANLSLLFSLTGNDSLPRDVFIAGQNPSDLPLPACVFQDSQSNIAGTFPNFFVNPGVGNYHLNNPFAPPVDAANNTSFDGKDKDGVPHQCALIGCQNPADMGCLEFTEFDCTDNCQLPQCFPTQECAEFRCDLANVNCNDQDCLTDPECQEGFAFGNCQDGINNNPLQNILTDCADPNCSGSAICNPTPTPTATPTATPSPTPTPTSPPTPTPTPTTPPTATPTSPATPTATPTSTTSGGGNGCSIAANPVQLGTAFANILIPLVPAFAVGYRYIRRKRQGSKEAAN